ncbi:MAG: hypothetical protein HQK53_14735 [Oligoflexia bacterium]|nr:hypothetical protein [Oligoflexia bacterium]
MKIYTKIIILTLSVFLITSSTFALENKEHETVSVLPVDKKMDILSEIIAAIVEKSSEPPINYFDYMQRYISTNWVELNYNLDAFFTNQQYDRKENKSSISFSYEAFYKENSPFRNLIDYRLITHFPRAGRKLGIVIQNVRDEVFESTNDNDHSSRATKNSVSTGVTYSDSDSPYWKNSFEIGIVFEVPLNPYAKYKISKTVETKIVTIDASQRFILYRQESFSEITQLLFSKQITTDISIGQDNALTWTYTDHIFVLRNSIGLVHRLNDICSLSYSTGANAFLSPKLDYYRYDAAVGYNQKIHNEYLLGNITVGAEFLEKNAYKMDRFISARMEVLFF